MKAGLVLARDRLGDEDLGVDDEVLHVSNAPLFIAAEKRAGRSVRGGDGEEWFVSRSTSTDSPTDYINAIPENEGTKIKEYEFSRSASSKEDEDTITDEEWKTREEENQA